MIYIYIEAVSLNEDFYSKETLGMRIHGIDVLLYYKSLWSNLFVGFPFVVKVSSTIVMLSIIGIIILLVFMIIDMLDRRKYEKRFKYISERYYDSIKEVSEDFNQMDKDAIIQKIGYEQEDWSKKDMMIWITLFVELRAKRPYYAPISNFQAMLDMVGIVDFVEHELTYGPHNKKSQLMEALLYLHGNVSEPTLIRLANDSDIKLRKSSRIFYMWLGKDDPYRFFEEDTYIVFSYWDQLEIHQIFEDRLIYEKDVPSFIPLIKQIKKTNIVAFMILETGYWGNEIDMRYIMDFFSSSNLILRKAAFECIGINRFEEAEQNMMDLFYEQPNSIQYVIIKSILSIKSGKAIDFLCDVYKKSTSDHVRREALRCLWLYGHAGQEAFMKLKSYVLDNDKILFEHVMNKIINNELDV